jgi:OPA family glycerol-3-phosphate transporter-like MFS transporter
MNRLMTARTLEVYPVGAHRWSLLGLTVLSAILASYEFQLAPLLPILLPYLHMSHVGYGSFVTFALAVGAISAVFGGPLADRYGRVILIDACLGAVTILLFANLLITNIVTFVIVRTSMGVVAGLMAGAIAALMRDISPRVSRALAFGLLTIGPVGANYMANSIAGLTLPIYHSWQSQIWIMGFSGLAMYIPCLIWLCDLSPELRMRIYKSELAVREAEGRMPTASELPSGTRDAFARLLAHREIWLLVVGVTASLTLYIAIQAFGPLMFIEAFHTTAADAATLNSYFWAANIVVLIITGIVSDWLQIRRPIAIVGGTLAALVMLVWIPMFGHETSRSTLALMATAMGCSLALCYVPWAARFSEALEDVSPALQATGWALYGLAARVWTAIAAPLMLYVAVHYGWGRWIEVSVVGMLVFIGAMYLSHESVLEASEAAPSPATEPAAAAR